MIFLVMLLMGLGVFLGVLVSGLGALLGMLFLTAPFMLLSAAGLVLQVVNFVLLFITMLGGGIIGLLSFI